jgi:OOP family OmpA-OmpF porin
MQDRTGPTPAPGGPAPAAVQHRSYSYIAVTPSAIETLQRIQFQLGSDVIVRESFSTLDEIVQALKDAPTMTLEIQGHTDSQGAMEYNVTLSQKRAESVMSYLVHHGIDRTRLTAKGYGPSRPIDTNDTAEGRANNRRIELVRTDTTHP